MDWKFCAKVTSLSKFRESFDSIVYSILTPVYSLMQNLTLYSSQKSNKEVDEIKYSHGS
jgi:hypothetical protein